MKQHITNIINSIIRHTDWYNNIFWTGATKFWNQTQFGLDIVNLGSGAGVYAFNYDELSIKGSNWALGPQSLIHDLNILRNYFSYLKEGGFVIIVVCPFSCLESHYDKNHNLKYYTFLHPATILNFNEEERTRALLIKNNPFKQMPVYCIKQTLWEIKTKIATTIRPQKNDLQKTAIDMMNCWKSQFGLDDLSAPISEKHLGELQGRKKTLIEIIDFCKERALKPVIVIPPMYHTLTSMFPGEFKMNYIDVFLRGIDIPVYDYMKDVEMDNEEYYQTALFLNKKGAKKFTIRVLKDIGIL